MHRKSLKRQFGYDPEREIIGKPNMKDKMTITRGLGKRSRLKKKKNKENNQAENQKVNVIDVFQDYNEVRDSNINN